MLHKTSSRRATQLRPITIQRHFTETAAGSVLFAMGNTRVLCTASFVEGVPRWREGSGLGWLTAEYSMLPASTTPRKSRPRNGHTDGRGQEIQRLIGRALRSVVDFEKLGENTIYIDCDVLQADGGTRTTAINGGYIALVDAVRYGIREGFVSENPVRNAIAAVSVGVVNDKVVLDLDYELDSNAQVDMNVVMTGDGQFVELQGSAEKATFNDEQLTKMITYARRGIKNILSLQKQQLAEN